MKPPKKTAKTDDLETLTQPVKRSHFSSNRDAFLYAYEQTFGNVSASCEFAGISRVTYYRWVRSPTPLNRKFRERLEKLRPKEQLVDLLEGQFVNLVRQGDVASVIFGLKTQGKARGWSERPSVQEANESELMRLRTAIRARADQKGVPYKVELRNYLDNYAGSVREEIRTQLAVDLDSV